MTTSSDEFFSGRYCTQFPPVRHSVEHSEPVAVHTLASGEHLFVTAATCTNCDEPVYGLHINSDVNGVSTASGYVSPPSVVELCLLDRNFDV